jgi:hypothetical protein
MAANLSENPTMAAPAKKSDRALPLKAEAKAMIDRLPDKGLSWDRLAYHMSVRGDIEAGLADVKAGRVYTTEQVRTMFGL